MLVLEDLHWAPEPTLAMLSHVVESTAGEQLLVLATRRTTAPDRTDTVSFTLADLHRLDGVARIDLVGLTTEDVVEYLVREAGVSLGAARAAAPMLRDHTGGNPFFLQEYWHDLASRGGLAAVRAGNAQAPGSVQDALARRLAAFDLAHTRVLELAAVAGDVVDPTLLVQACDLGSDAVLEGIDLAVRAGLLVANADAGGEGYRFVHSLARQAVLDQIAATDLAAAHARVARVLETRVGGDDPGLMAQLAHHYVQARALGHGDKAVRYLVLAAQQAVRGIAHSEAAALYERAAQLHVADGPPRAELLSAAARCHMHAGHFPTARQHLRGAGHRRGPPGPAAGRHRSRGRVVATLRERSAFLAMLSEARRAAALEDRRSAEHPCPRQHGTGGLVHRRPQAGRRARRGGAAACPRQRRRRPHRTCPQRDPVAGSDPGAGPHAAGSRARAARDRLAPRRRRPPRTRRLPPGCLRLHRGRRAGLEQRAT